MPLKNISLKQFLGTANVPSDLSLPWTHSTSASNLFEILEKKALIAAECTVFKPDKLCYFFVGRPAYKTATDETPSPWQLPVAFVMRFEKPPNIKRAFPFDSGAFHHKILPNYITMFKRDGFDLGGDKDLIGRLVSFYFKDQERYVMRRPVGEEELKDQYDLDMRHAEILALHRLYLEKNSTDFDDRAAAVELQIEEDVPITNRNLLGIVMPAEYGRLPELMTELKKLTTYIEEYDVFPISAMAAYGQVYQCVKNIYKRAGIAF